MSFPRLSWIAFPVGIPSLVLVFVGAIKLLSMASGADILRMQDQLVGLKFWQLYLALGSMEVVAGLLATFVLSRFTASVVLLGFGVLFLTYRVYALATGANHFCPCLGTAVDWIPGLAAYQDRLLTSVALWFCLTGLWSLWKAP